jgi:hypothetical protein
MVRLVAIMVITILFSGCNNDGSVKVKMDSLGKKFDSSAQRLYDSAKEKGKELKENIKNKLENKDSAH